MTGCQKQSREGFSKMKEPTEAVKMIARALIGDPPGTREKNELYREVGRAIVKLSDTENMLALLFAIVSSGDKDDAAGFFHQQSGFERKLGLVHFTMKGNAPREGLVNWNKIYAVLGTHKGVRNLVAHQGMHVSAPDEHGDVIVLLRPPWLKKTTKGRELDVKSIRSTADALSKAHDDLWHLIQTLYTDDDIKAGQPLNAQRDIFDLLHRHAPIVRSMSNWPAASPTALQLARLCWAPRSAHDCAAPGSLAQGLHAAT